LHSNAFLVYGSAHLSLHLLCCSSVCHFHANYPAYVHRDVPGTGAHSLLLKPSFPKASSVPMSCLGRVAVSGHQQPFSNISLSNELGSEWVASYSPALAGSVQP
jgi:hypothetical protein